MACRQLRTCQSQAAQAESAQAPTPTGRLSMVRYILRAFFHFQALTHAMWALNFIVPSGPSTWETKRGTATGIACLHAAGEKGEGSAGFTAGAAEARQPWQSWQSLQLRGRVEVGCRWQARPSLTGALAAPRLCQLHGVGMVLAEARRPRLRLGAHGGHRPGHGVDDSACSEAEVQRTRASGQGRGASKAFAPAGSGCRSSCRSRRSNSRQQ